MLTETNQVAASNTAAKYKAKMAELEERLSVYLDPSEITFQIKNVIAKYGVDGDVNEDGSISKSGSWDLRATAQLVLSGVVKVTVSFYGDEVDDFEDVDLGNSDTTEEEESMLEIWEAKFDYALFGKYVSHRFGIVVQDAYDAEKDSQ